MNVHINSLQILRSMD